MVNSEEANCITDFVIILRGNDNDGDGYTDRSPNATEPSKDNDSDGLVIGKIGIYAPLPSSRTGEIGFMLNRSYHRRGLISETLTAVLGYLFDRYPRHHLQALSNVSHRAFFCRWRH